MSDNLNNSKKEQNIERVVKTALKLFVEKGIDNTSIMEIANEAGLTERSIFRYFETKTDLVVEASFLLWNTLQNDVGKRCAKKIKDSMPGAEQINVILKEYIQFYFTSSKELIFIHEMEAYLYRMGKYKKITNKPPYHYDSKTSPLINAIAKGVRDGSVNPELDLTSLYYNTYDALLGIMQKMTIANDGTKEFNILAAARLDLACDMISKSFTS